MKQIGMLWMRGNLSFLEHLCMKSFQDAGHHVVLYSYEPIGHVPDGVEHRDADAILPEAGSLVHAKSGSPAPHADKWRYRMLQATSDIIWADTDAYCLKPFVPKDGHYYGWESDHHVNVGVLGLPQDSATLDKLVAHTSDDFAIPKWYGDDYIAELQAAADAGNPVHAGDQKWAVWGPHAFTYFLQETGEVRHAVPRDVLYPFSFRDRRKIVKDTIDPTKFLTSNTESIHLYGRRMRAFLGEVWGGLPPSNGLFGQLLIRHAIDPTDHPLRDAPNPDRDHPTAKAYRDAIHGKQYPAVDIPVKRMPSYKTDMSDTDVVPAKQADPVVQFKHTPRTPVATPVADKAADTSLKSVIAITTMKNEGPYILDWVAHHLAIGFTHFLVYTNDCSDGTDAILDMLAGVGIVTRIDNPADISAQERPQRIALEMAKTHPVVQNADCYFVFDVDEYINIHVGDGHLRDLFEASGNPDLISLTWRFFGCGNVLDLADMPVPAQFFRCAPKEVRVPHHNWGFKTLVRNPSVFDKIGIHRPLRPNTDVMPRWTNGSGDQMPDDYLDSGWRSNKRCWGYDLATLNHYSIRSLDAFLLKRDRGRTNHINRDQGIGYWNVHNRNDEEDRSILRMADRTATMRNLLEQTIPGLTLLHDQSYAWHVARLAQLRGAEPYKSLRARLAEKPLSHDVDEDLDVGVDDLPVAPAPVAAIGRAPAPLAVAATAPIAAPKVASGGTKTAIDLRQAGAVKSKGAKPEKLDGDVLMAEAHPDLVRMENGDVLATRDLNTRLYSSLEIKADRKFPRLAPLAQKQSNTKITVVTGMRNEAPFILEWVAYHMSIGVTHFLVYTNDCDDPTNDILDRLATHGMLTRLDNPFKRDKGQKPQRAAFNDAIDQPAVKDADWCLPMDVDEFVNVHHGDGTLPAMLDAMNDPNIVSFLWRFFGTTTQRQYQDRWITEDFTNCAPLYIPKVARDPDNTFGLRDGSDSFPPDGRLMAWGYKTMVHKSAPFDKIGVHRPLKLDEARASDVRWVNGSGRMFPEDEYQPNNWRATRKSAGYAMATLNHYALRSAESYLVKKQRGRINHVDEDQDQTYWKQRNYTVEHDNSIHRHLPRAKAVLADLMKDEVLAKHHIAAVAWHQKRIADLLQDPDYQQLYDAITKQV